MRLLGVLALVAPVAIGILLRVRPGPDRLVGRRRAPGRSSPPSRPSTIGVAMTAGRRRGCIVRIRFGRLVKAAERIAAGDYTVDGPDQRRRPRGPPRRAPSTRSPPRSPRRHDRATIDRLTGVANRQALLAALFAEVERATRYERPLSVAFVDIDHFKAVNDTYGHAAGDIVLRGVAQTHRRRTSGPAT